MFPDFTVLYADVLRAADIVFSGALYWLPFLLGFFFFHFWLKYIRGYYIANLPWVMLEVTLPREINKTPLAMEIVLGALHQTSEPDWYEVLFLGKSKPWFSLEIVSLEGAVKFFIRSEKKFKPSIEAQLYAQYPTIEIHEVPDYTTYVNHNKEGSEWGLFGGEVILTGEDAKPIRTYVDYGLDKAGAKEEFKIDPITATIEALGSMGKDQQMWIQIMVTGAGKRFKKKGSWFEKTDWKGNAQEVIDDLIAKGKKRGGESGRIELTEIEQNTIKAIDRNIRKLGFDCGIRALYLAKGSAFNGDHISTLLGLWKPYAENDLNGFKPKNLTKMDHPWQDFKDIRATKKKRQQFDAYRRRSYFFLPYERKPFVLNSEELATIFHFPGGVAETPTFGRIESRKSEPPANLPI